jgi:hypothetical protein
MIEIVNLTPHEFIFIDYDDECIVVKPSGRIAKVSTDIEFIGETIEGIPVTESKSSKIEGLPDPEPGKGFIVDRLVAEHVTERDDIFIPDVPVIDNGVVIGYRSIRRI